MTFLFSGFRSRLVHPRQGLLPEHCTAFESSITWRFQPLRQDCWQGHFSSRRRLLLRFCATPDRLDQEGQTHQGWLNTSVHLSGVLHEEVVDQHRPWKGCQRRHHLSLSPRIAKAIERLIIDFNKIYYKILLLHLKYHSKTPMMELVLNSLILF